MNIRAEMAVWRGLSMMVLCLIKMGTCWKTLLKVIFSAHYGATEIIKSVLSTLFFVHLREITLHTFLKNLAWHISGLKLCYAQVLEGQYRSSSLLLYSVNEWRVIECSTPRHLYKAEVLQCEGQREGERERVWESSRGLNGAKGSGSVQ